MVKLIYGSKGMGKTKLIIEECNSSAVSSKGDVVYLTDRADHSREINHKVRFIDTTSYISPKVDSLKDFVKGILAGNNDVVKICIDGIARMTGLKPNALHKVIDALDALSAMRDLDFVITVSTDKLPKNLLKYT